MRSYSVRILAAFALCLGFAACGGDDDDGDGATIDAPGTVIDAPPQPIDAPAVTNALGQTCTAAAPNCPAGNTCITITGIGSQTTGYCSPACMGMDTICSTGYTGPAGTMQRCLLGAQGQPPDACAIICTLPAQCPTGLTCIDTGQGASICAAPP